MTTQHAQFTVQVTTAKVQIKLHPYHTQSSENK